MSAEPPTQATPDEVAQRAQADHEAERRLSSEIYGLIIASSVLAASADDDDIVHVAGSVLGTLLVYWLAETYAHVMAARHVTGRSSAWTAVRHDLRTGWPLVSASFIPLIVVVLAAIVGADVEIAETAGLICATVLLFASGWVAGRRRGSTGFGLFGGAVAAACFGVVLVGLKATLH